MTAYEKAHGVIAEFISSVYGDTRPEWPATKILDALNEKNLVVVVSKGSPDMLKRWHAHCRYLGKETGDGYEGIYNEAIKYAVERDEWPVKVIAQEVCIASEMITIDVQVPQSTTRATDKQLLCAYEYITSVAAEHKISLPERYENERD